MSGEIQGLTSAEAIERQKKYGSNKLDEKKPTPLVVLFLSQFADILRNTVPERQWKV